RDVLGLRDVRDAGQRRPQVALDVDRERLERGHVHHAAPFGGRWRRLEEQPVEAPEERRERLAAPGRGEDERRLAARDRGPAKLLRLGRRVERAAKPRAYGRTKQIQRRPATHHVIVTADLAGCRADADDPYNGIDSLHRMRMTEALF